MKILERTILTDGTAIRREDWSRDYGFMAEGTTVAAYHIAKESIDGYFTPKRGEKFRLAICFGNDTQAAKDCYSALVNGEKNLKDFAKHFEHQEYAKII